MLAMVDEHGGAHGALHVDHGAGSDAARRDASGYHLGFALIVAAADN